MQKVFQNNPEVEGLISGINRWHNIPHAFDDSVYTGR
jgi:hypothetical protein